MCYKCEECNSKFEGNKEISKVSIQNTNLAKKILVENASNCPICGSNKILKQIRALGRKEYTKVL